MSSAHTFLAKNETSVLDGIRLSAAMSFLFAKLIQDDMWGQKIPLVWKDIELFWFDTNLFLYTIDDVYTYGSRKFSICFEKNIK